MGMLFYMQAVKWWRNLYRGRNIQAEWTQLRFGVFIWNFESNGELNPKRQCKSDNIENLSF